MADETTVDTQVQQPPAVDPQIEAEARRGGWKPKDQWRGDQSGWVDAQTFVQRGREILPHVRAHAAQLEQENAALKAEQARYAEKLRTMEEQVTGLTTFRSEMDQRERTRMRAELTAELAQARSDGDVVREASVIAKLGRPEPEPVRPAPVVTQPVVTEPVRPQIPPEMTAWVGANEWYQRDPVLQQAMNLVGADLRASGQLVGMSLTDQLNATAKVVLQRYAPPPANGGPRVEGSRPSGDGSGSRSMPTDGFEALPAHLKVECDAQGERLGLIGEKKIFKTKEQWRAHYAKEVQRYAPGVGYDYRPQGN
jgi:hypothetical protein